jgi:hypothetical protein
VPYLPFARLRPDARAPPEDGNIAAPANGKDGLVKLGGVPIPGQQFGDASARVACDACVPIYFPPWQAKRKPPMLGASLPCAVIRTDSFGQAEQPQLPFGSLKESGAVGIPASDTAKELEERSNDTKT